MVPVVRVAGLLGVPPAGGLVAGLDVRIRVEGVHHRGPVAAEQPDEDADQLVVVVGVRAGDGRTGRQMGPQLQGTVVPERGQGHVAPVGVHGQVEEDQLYAASTVRERVRLRPPAVGEREHLPPPGREHRQAERRRVRLAQALVARRGVGGAVRGSVRHPLDPVPAGVLAGGHVHGDERDPGVEEALGVGVHEVQVVVRVRGDLQEQRPPGPRGGDRLAGRGVDGRGGPARLGHGTPGDGRGDGEGGGENRPPTGCCGHVRGPSPGLCGPQQDEYSMLGVVCGRAAEWQDSATGKRSPKISVDHVEDPLSAPTNG